MPASSRLLKLIFCFVTMAAAHAESLYSGMEILVDRAKVLTPSTLPAAKDAAAAGNGEALVVLGFAYTMGSAGLPQDNSKAAVEFERAAQRGNVFGQLMMATMCLEGTGVARDEAGAVRWLRKAVEHRNPEAAYMLGSVLHRGADGVEANPVEALKWFKVAMSITTNEGKRKAFELSAKVNANDLAEAQIALSDKQAREWLASHPAQ